MSFFDYKRRMTVPVSVGSVIIGGEAPVKVQSMTNTSTMDTEASVAQCRRLAEAGADIVRLTAQGVREAANLGLIHDSLRRQGCDIPLVADIHFNPKAAFEAATRVEKVRINPGNFVDPGRTFRLIDYTDEQYRAELHRIEEAFVPFLELCRRQGTAIRLGVNHGSLSDRIMSRYGNTPQGMVESAMEFLRVAIAHDFTDIVVSIKASNVKVMVETVKLLARTMDEEGMAFPIHLGVTEAGDGDDGRIKSAVGIGSLLNLGIGDTIRVSLSEAPENEVPVARMILDHIDAMAGAPSIEGNPVEGYDFTSPEPRFSSWSGGKRLVVLRGTRADHSAPIEPVIMEDDVKRFPVIDTSTAAEQLSALIAGTDASTTVVLTSSHPNFAGSIRAAIHAMRREGLERPVIVKARYEGLSRERIAIAAAIDLGGVLLDGVCDAIWIEDDILTPEENARLAYDILQATRDRITKTEYIACPGCGRTLFDLQTTLARVKEATPGLKGYKIAVMGCIVNGPGEMADADYGYVGAGAGRVSLYRGKECVIKNIPADDAIDALLQLLNDDGIAL